MTKNTPRIYARRKLSTGQLFISTDVVDIEVTNEEALRLVNDLLELLPETYPLAASRLETERLKARLDAGAKETAVDYTDSPEGQNDLAQAEEDARTDVGLDAGAPRTTTTAIEDRHRSLIQARNDIAKAMTTLRGGHTATMDDADTALASLDIAIGKTMSLIAALSAGGERPAAPPPLTFADLVEANLSRVVRWHPAGLTDWTPLEWAGAMCGEAGEAANAAKKLKRHVSGLQNRDGRLTDDGGAADAKTKHYARSVAKEVADTIIYGALLVAAVGEDLPSAIIDVFDAKSEEYGFPERLSALPRQELSNHTE